MSDEYSLAEMGRMLASVVRFGRVTAVDLVNARVQVRTAGLDSDWLPWLTARAGAVRTWSAPSVGEQVVVLAQNGDPSQGVVLCSVYQDANPAPSAVAAKDVIQYPDGTRIEYDSATHALAITVAASGTVTINCNAATINAAQTTLTGNLQVNGGIVAVGDIIAGTISLKQHGHPAHNTPPNL